jgi:hypothetical protein
MGQHDTQVVDTIYGLEEGSISYITIIVYLDDLIELNLYLLSSLKQSLMLVQNG